MCVCVCVYVCMWVCVYVCMYVCMYVRMYVCMHVCMYACMPSFAGCSTRNNQPWNMEQISNTVRVMSHVFFLFASVHVCSIPLASCLQFSCPHNALAHLAIALYPQDSLAPIRPHSVAWRRCGDVRGFVPKLGSPKTAKVFSAGFPAKLSKRLPQKTNTRVEGASMVSL